MKDKREASLPKWAQSDLAIARRRGDEAEAALKALFPDAETNTHWVESYDKRYPLPNNASIRFQLGPGMFDYIEVRRDEEEKALYIYGPNTIKMRPATSNAGWISLARLGQE